MLYYEKMVDEQVGIIPGALERALKLRGISPAQLARDSGVSKGTISLILSGERPNTPAVIVAKLARALDVSMDYLVGIVEDPEPRSLDIGELLLELTRVARQLSDRRQRDLLLMAQSFLVDTEKRRGDATLLITDLMGLIQESGGTISMERLIGVLRDDERSLEDTEQPPRS